MKTWYQHTTNRRSLVFVVLFMSIYGLFHYGYFMIPDSFLKDRVYRQGIVEVCSQLINLVVPEERVFARNNIMQSPRAALEIVRGCDGIGSMMLVVAAIIAFSATFRHKLIGLVAGLSLMYLLNLIRVIALYFVNAYQGSWFTSVHTLLAPTLVVMLGCVFFAWWAMWSSHESRSQTTA